MSAAARMPRTTAQHITRHQISCGHCNVRHESSRQSPLKLTPTAHPSCATPRVTGHPKKLFYRRDTIGLRV